MKPIYILWVGLLLHNLPVVGQNLIRNGSFEQAKPYESKLLWSTSKSQFNGGVAHWSSATGGTPDIILDRYRGKPSFERSGLDVTPCLARTGKSIVAIRVFGCKSSHCREYIQTQTKQPLKKGCTYNYEFYAQPAVSSIRVNNLGIAFSGEAIDKPAIYEVLAMENAQSYDELVYSQIGHWVKIEGEYTMDKDYNNIIIGNFYDDKSTKARQIEGGMSTAYYLIDDVSLSLKSCPIGITPPIGDLVKITVDDILFEKNSAMLKSSLTEIYQQIMRQNYKSITINGHTDNSGTSSYNLKLSNDRAMAVLQALRKLGIPTTKMTAVGHGSNKPISTTKDELNRRVVIDIRT